MNNIGLDLIPLRRVNQTTVEVLYLDNVIKINPEWENEDTFWIGLNDKIVTRGRFV